MATKKDVIEYLERNPTALKGKFKVSRDVPLIRKTFVCEKALVTAFMKEAKKRDMKVQDAINQAIRQWLKAK